MIKIVIVALLWLVLTPALAGAKTFYVSTQGSNSNTCAQAETQNTTSLHKLTINAGLACIAADASPNAGHTVNVGPGVFPETIAIDTIPSGTSDTVRTRLVARNPIRGTPDRSMPSPTISSAIHAIMKPTGTCNSNVAMIRIGTGQRWIEIDGMVLDSNNLCWISVRFEPTLDTDPLTHIRVQNSAMINGLGQANTDAGSGMITGAIGTASGHTFSQIEFINNEIGPVFHAKGNGGMDFDPTDSLAEYNYIHGTKIGISSHHTHPNQASGFIVRFNRIERQTTGCIQMAVQAYVYGNVCMNTGGGERTTAGTFFSQGAFRTVISNVGGAAISSQKWWSNTSHGVYPGGQPRPCYSQGFLSAGTGSGNEFRNNLCTGSADTVVFNDGSVLPMTFSNNRCMTGANCLTIADPAYEDSAGGDFHLTASTPSPIHDGGLTVSFNVGAYPLATAVDLVGTSRPQDLGWDIGAYEFTVTPPLPPFPASPPARAFLDAEGYGALATTTCTRDNVQVITVSSLANSGAGTFREAVTTTPSNDNRLKIVRFSIAGYITISSDVNITKPCIYIAGQTAPGPIVIKGTGDTTVSTIWVESGATNFVMRYVQLAGIQNFIYRAPGPAIIDHMSMRWMGGPDDGVTTGTAATISKYVGHGSEISGITLSHNLMAEPLDDHPVGNIISEAERWYPCGRIKNVDVHHNLYVHVSHRLPLVSSSCETKVINNVLYDQNQGGVQSGGENGSASLDAIANFIKSGPRTAVSGRNYEVTPECSFTANIVPANAQTFNGALVGLHASKNIGPHCADPAADNHAGACRVVGCFNASGINGSVHGTDPEPLAFTSNGVTFQVVNKRVAPLPGPTHAFPVIEQTAVEAYTNVVTNGNVGATKRLDCAGQWIDSITEADSRYLTNVRNGTRTLDPSIAAPAVPTDVDATPYPSISAGTACVSTSGDGVPDDYKTAWGLSLSGTYASTDLRGDGWTVLERYLMGARPIPDQAPEPPGTPPPPPVTTRPAVIDRPAVTDRPSPIGGGGGGGTPPPVSFIEIPSGEVSIGSLGGYCFGGNQPTGGRPAAGADAVYIAFMDNQNTAPAGETSCAFGSHNIKVIKGDYLTGQWSAPTTIATIDPGCCDGHDSPVIHRNPVSGQLETFYGAIALGLSGSTRIPSPGYRRSTAPNSVTQWNTQELVPWNGGFSEPAGGFGPDGTLYIAGQHQWGVAGVAEGFQVVFGRRTPGGAWSVSQIVKDGGVNPNFGNTFAGEPGCQVSMTPRTWGGVTKLHMVWARTVDACSGQFHDIYYAESSDGGVTWTNAAGNATFSQSSPLLCNTFDVNGRWDCPSAYRVFQGTTIRHTFRTDRLSGGQPVVLFRTSTGIQLRRWNGSSWVATTVSSTAGGPFGAELAITSTNKILVYGPDGQGTGAVTEWASSDNGVTWSATILHTRGSEATNRYVNATVATVGGKERVLVTWWKWFAAPSGGPSIPSRLMFVNRSQ